jgi:undecaprenyl-diphosphatase
MKLQFIVPGLALLILVVATAHFPYFPGDIYIARLIQAIIPNTGHWAEFISSFASFPSYFILLAFSILFTFILTRNWLLVVDAILSFVGILIIEKILRRIIFQPRPSECLIQVYDVFSGSSFPSGTALMYGSTFGFVLILALMKQTRYAKKAIVLMVLSFLMLILAFLARIILGAHWPSDMLLSYAVASAWIYLILRFF